MAVGSPHTSAFHAPISIGGTGETTVGAGRRFFHFGTP
jgi:hypothetical protein